MPWCEMGTLPRLILPPHKCCQAVCLGGTEFQAVRACHSLSWLLACVSPVVSDSQAVFGYRMCLCARPSGYLSGVLAAWRFHLHVCPGWF